MPFLHEFCVKSRSYRNLSFYTTGYVGSIYEIAHANISTRRHFLFDMTANQKTGFTISSDRPRRDRNPPELSILKLSVRQPRERIDYTMSELS